MLTVSVAVFTPSVAVIVHDSGVEDGVGISNTTEPLVSGAVSVFVPLDAVQVEPAG
jgi:hypothetical protein